MTFDSAKVTLVDALGGGSQMSGVSYVFYSIYPFVGLLLLGFQAYLMYLLFRFLTSQLKKEKSYLGD